MTAPIAIRALDVHVATDVDRGRRVLAEYVQVTADEILEARDPAAGSTREDALAFIHGVMPDSRDLVGVYGNDRAVFLVAETPASAGSSSDADFVGCVGITPVDPPEATEALRGACEMNRLYVAARVRRAGLGRRLVDASLDAARSLGFSRMVLDVVPYRTGAIALYRSAGFRDGPHVIDHPICTVPLERDL
ncbi:MAG: GNAT family N-acetyltransferase [Acidimicrobiia bacterium]|nr:GNAT family N-acetyltransferase [Acidimicrobiia bacterium]